MVSQILLADWKQMKLEWWLIFTAISQLRPLPGTHAVQAPQVNFRLDSKIPEDLVGAFTNGQFKSEINSAFTSTDIINSWCWKKGFHHD